MQGSVDQSLGNESCRAGGVWFCNGSCCSLMVLSAASSEPGHPQDPPCHSSDEQSDLVREGIFLSKRTLAWWLSDKAGCDTAILCHPRCACWRISPTRAGMGWALLVQLEPRAYLEPRRHSWMFDELVNKQQTTLPCLGERASKLLSLGEKTATGAFRLVRWSEQRQVPCWAFTFAEESGSPFLKVLRFCFCGKSSRGHSSSFPVYCRANTQQETILLSLLSSYHHGTVLSIVASYLSGARVMLIAG